MHQIRFAIGGLAAVLLTLGAYASEPVLFTAEDDQLYSIVKARISLETFSNLSPFHKQMAARLVSAKRPGPDDLAVCFDGQVPDDLMTVFNDYFYGPGGAKFEPLVARWFVTATDGAGLAVGDPTTLTYSFVPDGTNMPGNPGIGNSAAPSDLFAFFDGIYGSTAAWQAEFAQMFADWSTLTGITYVFEPNDDGNSMPESGVSNGSPGAVGVRGDVRIGGYFIDGEIGSNVLAFNFYPPSGDMFIDTANPTFYGNTSGDSIRLRNTISHEHGHGLGLPHTCPVLQTKLMEPFISTLFDGPQLDDILSAQKSYSDVNVGNVSTGTAADLGALTNETATASTVSLFGNAEEDFFEFTVGALQDITVTLTPTGFTYLSGPQVGMCNTGSSFNTLEFMNLDVELIDSDGSTILATGNTGGVGVAESVNVLTGLGDAGTYFVRVFSGGVANNVQAYALDVTVASIAGPILSNETGGGLYEVADDTVVLNVDVTNTVDPTTYQWLKGSNPLVNGGSISGADTETLTISPIAQSDTGMYQLEVTDSSAKLIATSNPIVVQVVSQLPAVGLIGLALLAGGCAAAGVAAFRRRKL